MEHRLLSGACSSLPWESGGPTKGMQQMSPQQLGAALTSL